MTMDTSQSIKVWSDRYDRLLRVRLAQPKANLIDAAMIAGLDEVFTKRIKDSRLRAVLLDAEGPHFSFGASVEEHLPAKCAAMLQSLHGLLLMMIDAPLPILTAIRGQCLGGGLEVAMATTLIFAAPGARFGQPEVKLAVIAPAASCLLPERVGRAHADDILLSGRTLDSQEAFRIGLVHEVADDPEAAALSYFDQHLAQLSASSVRFAVKAARMGMAERLRTALAAMEKVYLEELMATRDALEGLQSFIEKRPPKWEDG